MAKEKGILSHDTNSKPFEKRVIYTGTLGQTLESVGNRFLPKWDLGLIVVVMLNIIRYVRLCG